MTIEISTVESRATLSIDNKIIKQISIKDKNKLINSIIKVMEESNEN